MTARRPHPPPPDQPEERLDDLERRAWRLATGRPPGFIRHAIRERIWALAAARDAGRAIAATQLDALEALLDREAEYVHARAGAVRRYEALVRAATADADLAALLALIRALDAGKLEPDDFFMAFDHAALRLEAAFGP